MDFYLTGDKHGDFYAILKDGIVKSKENAIIILGDAGFNYYLNKADARLKQKIIENSHCRWYCVRGNHEARPEDISGMDCIFDQDIQGYVYIQNAYPQIRYLRDGGTYQFGKYRAAAIGGAYSVDKWWRLMRAGVMDKSDPAYCNPKKTGWFYNEQLTSDEMERISQNLSGHYDFIFSHTCPISWEPTDLFLNSVNQSEVDKTMELWFEELKDKIDWNIWCFGHYHADRMERPHVEMYYHDIELLEDVFNRWALYDKGNEIDWWLVKSPNYYMSV